MQKRSTWVVLIAMALVGFLAGRWTGGRSTVRADAGAAPQIEIRPIGGDASLTVYYPNLNKLFVYQNPFVGMPKWKCSYSVQLSAPGGPVERKACGDSDQ